MAFSRVSTGDSVIPSSCEMKYEPAFKPLQGNLAFFWVMASRSPFHLRQKTQSPSHITISEGRLLWGACRKLAYLLSRRQGIILIPRFYGVHGTFLKLLYWNWWSSILETVVSGSQATCSVWCGSRGGYGANAREIGLISIWYILTLCSFSVFYLFNLLNCIK